MYHRTLTFFIYLFIFILICDNVGSEFIGSEESYRLEYVDNLSELESSDPISTALTMNDMSIHPTPILTDQSPSSMSSGLKDILTIAATQLGAPGYFHMGTSIEMTTPLPSVPYSSQSSEVLDSIEKNLNEKDEDTFSTEVLPFSVDSTQLSTENITLKLPKSKEILPILDVLPESRQESQEVSSDADDMIIHDESIHTNSTILDDSSYPAVVLSSSYEKGIMAVLNSLVDDHELTTSPVSLSTSIEDVNFLENPQASFEVNVTEIPKTISNEDKDDSLDDQGSASSMSRNSRESLPTPNALVATGETPTTTELKDEFEEAFKSKKAKFIPKRRRRPFGPGFQRRGRMRIRKVNSSSLTSAQDDARDRNASDTQILLTKSEFQRLQRRHRSTTTTTPLTFIFPNSSPLTTLPESSNATVVVKNGPYPMILNPFAVTPGPQLERPINAFTEKSTTYFVSSQPYTSTPFEDNGDDGVSVTTNQDWHDSSNPKQYRGHLDKKEIPFVQERDSWEKNYMSLQQNSFYRATPEIIGRKETLAFLNRNKEEQKHSTLESPLRPKSLGLQQSPVVSNLEDPNELHHHHTQLTADSNKIFGLREERRDKSKKEQTIEVVTTAQPEFVHIRHITPNIRIQGDVNQNIESSPPEEQIDIPGTGTLQEKLNHFGSAMEFSKEEKDHKFLHSSQIKHTHYDRTKHRVIEDPSGHHSSESIYNVPTTTGQMKDMRHNIPQSRNHNSEGTVRQHGPPQSKSIAKHQIHHFNSDEFLGFGGDKHFSLEKMKTLAPGDEHFNNPNIPSRGNEIIQESRNRQPNIENRRPIYALEKSLHFLHDLPKPQQLHQPNPLYQPNLLHPPHQPNAFHQPNPLQLPDQPNLLHSPHQTDPFHQPNPLHPPHPPRQPTSLHPPHQPTSLHPPLQPDPFHQPNPLDHPHHQPNTLYHPDLFHQPNTLHQHSKIHEPDPFHQPKTLHPPDSFHQPNLLPPPNPLHEPPLLSDFPSKEDQLPNQHSLSSNPFLQFSQQSHGRGDEKLQNRNPMPDLPKMEPMGTKESSVFDSSKMGISGSYDKLENQFFNNHMQFSHPPPVRRGTQLSDFPNHSYATHFYDKVIDPQEPSDFSSHQRHSPSSSPIITLPMPGLVSIPTPPPESHALNQVYSNRHYPPHTHSMSMKDDYEPANPPIIKGHPRQYHFDPFIQNAGVFPDDEKKQSHRQIKSLSKSKSLTHIKAGQTFPRSSSYISSHVSNPYSSQDSENYNDSHHPFIQNVQKESTQKQHPKLIESEFKSKDFYQGEQYNEGHGPDQPDPDYEYNSEGHSPNKFSSLGELHRHIHRKRNEIHKSVKAFQNTLQLQHESTPKGSGPIFSENAYVLMFPSIVSESQMLPTRPQINGKDIPVVSASEPLDDKPLVRTTNPGHITSKVHPREQMLQVLATNRYDKEMERYMEKKKRLPLPIHTPYGLLVPMGHPTTTVTPPTEHHQHQVIQSSPKRGKGSSNVIHYKGNHGNGFSYPATDDMPQNLVYKYTDSDEEIKVINHPTIFHTNSEHNYHYPMSNNEMRFPEQKSNIMSQPRQGKGIFDVERNLQDDKKYLEDENTRSKAELRNTLRILLKERLQEMLNEFEEEHKKKLREKSKSLKNGVTTRNQVPPTQVASSMTSYNFLPPLPFLEQIKSKQIQPSRSSSISVEPPPQSTGFFQSLKRLFTFGRSAESSLPNPLKFIAQPLTIFQNMSIWNQKHEYEKVNRLNEVLIKQNPHGFEKKQMSLPIKSLQDMHPKGDKTWTKESNLDSGEKFALEKLVRRLFSRRRKRLTTPNSIIISLEQDKTSTTTEPPLFSRHSLPFVPSRSMEALEWTPIPAPYANYRRIQKAIEHDQIQSETQNSRIINPPITQKFSLENNIRLRGVNGIIASQLLDNCQGIVNCQLLETQTGILR